MQYKSSSYVAFQVRNYNAAVEFYKNILGFELLKYTETESKFKCGDKFFFVEQKEDGALRTYFEFSVGNINAAKEELITNGCKLLWQYTEKSFGFEDPYGFCFHVYEEGAELPDL